MVIITVMERIKRELRKGITEGIGAGKAPNNSTKAKQEEASPRINSKVYIVGVIN